jgi:hypothetical protein
MIYAAIAISVISFVSGFWLSYELDKGELWQLESAIARQKAEAGAILTGIIAKVEKQKKDQENANAQLESARQSSIETINAYHAQLANQRLRVTVAGHHCPGAVPETAHSAKLPGSATDSAYLTTEAASYLRGLALSADTCAVNHNALLTFVQSGCGLND